MLPQPLHRQVLSGNADGGSNHIPVIVSARGIAAFAVCWYHFTNGHAHFLRGGALQLSGSYGWLGVYVFFVISGFVLPHSLIRNHYKIRRFPRFIAKRFVRLEPPYFASILVILGLSWAARHVFSSQAPQDLSLARLVAHLAYLNAVLDYGWLNPVFWSLAVEFQFYIVIGLLFPLIVSRTYSARSLVVCSFVVFALLLPHAALLPHYLFPFLMGIVLCQFNAGIVRISEFLIVLAIAAAGCIFVNGFMVTVSTTLTVGILFLPIRDNMLMRFCGHISYSLYLLHVPVGMSVINILAGHASTFIAKLAVIIIAIGSSVLAAYLLYRFVEKPSQTLSSSIRYVSASSVSKEMSVDPPVTSVDEAPI